MTITVAIIGSGPAGFYTADALTKAECDLQVDIIERLPTPYGLIRGGVAPDHQTTKKVARKYEQTALFAHVNYYGNVEVNKDVSLAELREMYDAVVLAVGAPKDKKLTIPGADKAGVHGSAAFVGWYNAHPDFRDLDPNLDVANAVVVGNGNVALDVARVLVRSRQFMSGTDLADHAADAIHPSPIEDIWVAGRRGVAEAKFTNKELREMLDLTQAVALAKPDQLPDDLPNIEDGRQARLAAKNLETLRVFAAADPASKSKRVHFEFFASPVEILGGERVEGVRFERTELKDGRAVGTGETFDVPAGLVVVAIGYRADPIDGAPFDEASATIPNEDGRVDRGLYAVGWIKRGPSGVISSSRPDGETVARHICQDFANGVHKPGRDALERTLKDRDVAWVSFEDWQRIDAAEVAAGGETGAPRRKFADVADMLDVVNRPDTA